VLQYDNKLNTLHI